MYDALRRWTLRILKAPPEPQPPLGDPASLRVFNAGRNYLRLRLAGWAVAQLFALAGIIFWTTLLIDVESSTRAQIDAGTNKSAIDTPFFKKGERVKGWVFFKRAFERAALRLPSGAFAAIWAVKIISFLVYLAQIPLTYAVRRLDYEMRWYMVTDRSLRLRHGVWKISESTMSFANIQQVVVSQGPLQRLLGLGDVKVKSAGGGGGGGGSHGEQPSEADDMHTGQFRSVTNATEIRDLILERLRRFREAGLGDPEDKHAADTAPVASAYAITPEALAAAREVAAEARALRAVLG